MKTLICMRPGEFDYATIEQPGVVDPTAIGRNQNLFYRVEEITKPVISPKAVITPPTLKETLLYDIPTTTTTRVTLVAQ